MRIVVGSDHGGYSLKHDNMNILVENRYAPLI